MEDPPIGFPGSRRHTRADALRFAWEDSPMAIRTEGEITINRPRTEVFDYLAHGERLPEYIDDFERVTHEQEGEPGQGHVYSYKMKRGAEGTFEWTEFRPNDKLAWDGPAVKQGPGSMRPSGWWELSEANGGTRVHLVMAPEPGGLFKLMAPLMKRSMSKGNERALGVLKSRLEGGGS
jgi:uncharacterized protein YndB with AHSA1/START domain